MQFANVSVNYRPQTIAHQVYGNHNQVKPKFVSCLINSIKIILSLNYSFTTIWTIVLIYHQSVLVVQTQLKSLLKNLKQVVTKKIINYLKNLKQRWEPLRQLSLEVKNHKVLDFGDSVKQFTNNFFQSSQTQTTDILQTQLMVVM